RFSRDWSSDVCSSDLIAAGMRLCEELLEPLQDAFGRIAIRSAYRSAEVNGFGNEMQRRGRAGYTCSSNERTYANHIWDRRDADEIGRASGRDSREDTA